jgi:hypothetical protein
MRNLLLVALLATAQAPMGAPQTPGRADASLAYTCDTEAARTLVDALARDASVSKVDCVPAPDEVAARNELLARFVEVARSGKGRMAVAKTCATVEGDPLVRYLVADNGEVRLATDSRADRFGPKQVCSARAASVEIGFLDAKNPGPDGPRFVTDLAAAPPGTAYVLRVMPQAWDF